MQPANHMHFSDPERKSFFNDANDLLNRIFKSVGIALPGSEGAELTRKNADNGVVDITVMNVAGIIAVLSFAHEIGDHPQRIKIAGLIQSHRISVTDAFLALDFFCNGPKHI